MHNVIVAWLRNVPDRITKITDLLKKLREKLIHKTMQSKLLVLIIGLHHSSKIDMIVRNVEMQSVIKASGAKIQHDCCSE